MPKIHRLNRLLPPFPRHIRFNALLMALSLGLVSTPPQAVELEYIELPDMGDTSGVLISPVQEQELGAAFFRSLHSQLEISQDMEIQQYISGIGQQLVAQSELPGNPFHFFVVMDKNINAFAGPGGYIGVNSGLLLLSESESELASVMAHEVAHVTQRHLYRAFEAASKLSIPTAAAMLAAILLGMKSPQMAQAAIVAVQAGSTQYQIDFTRSHEEEADRVGMQILAQSNYDPRSMPNFFEKLQQSSRYYGRGIPEFLRTHPMSESRVADTRGRATHYPYRQYPDSQDYLLAKAKLRVVSATDIESVTRYFQGLEQQGMANQRAAARYGIGLTHWRSQRFNEATAIFEQLTQQYPNQPQYATALVRTAVDAGKYDDAFALFEKLNKHFPNNDTIKIDYIRTLLKTDHPQKARQLLESVNPILKAKPLYFELLSQSYADLGKKSESHRYLAEYYYAVGQTEAAILQIKLAKEQPDLSFQLQAILNERLSFFLNEEAERKKQQ